MKVQKLISIDTEVLEKLDLYAKENHMSRSAAITYLILGADILEKNIGGLYDDSEKLNV